MAADNHRLILKGSAVVALPGLLLCGLLWVSSRGPDRWPEPCRDLADALREGDRLDEAMRLIVRREEAKMGVVRDLLAGRLTLRQAAALFRDLDQGPPAFNWEEFRRAYPCDTDEERHCREVIDCVRGVLPANSPESEAIARRFEAELPDRTEQVRRPGSGSRPRRPRRRRGGGAAAGCKIGVPFGVPAGNDV
jgi:hypothetical protein